MEDNVEESSDVIIFIDFIPRPQRLREDPGGWAGLPIRCLL
jgi:hypothetical protein